EKYCALLDLAAKATDDEHFGLRFGATRAADTSTVLGYILRNSPTIGAAIGNAARYVRVHVDGVQISLSSAGAEARLVYRLTRSEKYSALLDLAAKATDDEHFGLRFGATRAADTSTVLGYILRNSPTIGAAIGNAARYVRVHVDGVQISLSSAGAEARLVYRLTDPTIVVSRHYAELLMVYAMHVFRLAADDDWAPHEVWFRHGPPADLAPYRRYFGASVRFHQSEYTTVFDSGILGRPLRTFDRQLLGILEEHAAMILAQLPPLDDDLLARLEQFVVGALPEDRAGVSAAARALGMSTRTLQRRLRERGIVFARLVEEV